MATKTILVTGIGGNVGQGILKIIQSLNYNIRLIGTDTHQFSSGNFLCDKIYKVPLGHNKTYISIIKKILSAEKVDIVLPSTDYETYFLSKHQKEFKSLVVSAEEKITKIYLDKYLTYLHHKKFNIPFAYTCLPKQYLGNFKSVIAKPRKGRGSRGVLINPIEPSSLSNEYILQPLLKGKEITTAVYVNKANLIHGLITMERELESGTTTKAKVVFDYDKELLKIATAMVANGKFKGSFNIQSIVDNRNKCVIPFEINCRISGTNSIRHNFGFRDIEYIMQEYLFNKEPEKIIIKSGIATRLLTDVIFLDTVDETALNKKSKFIIF